MSAGLTRLDELPVPQGWTPAIRSDIGRLSSAVRTPGGGVRIQATIAKTGILEYRRADGTVSRELVPKEELGNLESLQTLQDADVTIGHPEGGSRLVSPETHKTDSVGHVSGAPRFDGQFIHADLVIKDAEAIARVDAGELPEISAGYQVMIDPTPGRHDGRGYDVVQRRRKYNHVGLVEEGRARAGRGTRLRLDAIGDITDVAFQIQPNDPAPPQEPRAEHRSDAMDQNVTIEGHQYVLGTPAWQQARTRVDEKHRQALEAATKRADEAEVRVDTLTAELQVATSEKAELKTQLAVAVDPKRVDALVGERTNLFGSARTLLGDDVKLDGLTERAIRELVVAKDDPSLKLKGRTDEAVKIFYEAAVRHGSATSPLVQARGDAFPAAPPTSPAAIPGELPASRVDATGYKHGPDVHERYKARPAG